MNVFLCLSDCDVCETERAHIQRCVCILCIEMKCQFGGGRFNACFVLDYCACQCIRTIVA